MVKLEEIRDIPISEIHRSAIPYLFPSRYCQSDRLGLLAEKMFGHLSHPYSKTVAIADWIFENIDYLSGATDTATSAFDTVTQRAGVCRDFAHLGIALCRPYPFPPGTLRDTPATCSRRISTPASKPALETTGLSSIPPEGLPSTV
jgi:hypothetical protein